MIILVVNSSSLVLSFHRFFDKASDRYADLIGHVIYGDIAKLNRLAVHAPEIYAEAVAKFLCKQAAAPGRYPIDLMPNPQEVLKIDR